MSGAGKCATSQTNLCHIGVLVLLCALVQAIGINSQNHVYFANRYVERADAAERKAAAGQS